MKKNLKLIIVILIIAAISSAATVYFLKKERQVHQPIKVSGNIEGDDVRLSFRVSGQIVELLTDEGKVIKKGDVVAKLNIDEWSKETENAAAAMKQAEYEHELAAIDYKRAEALLAAGSIPTQSRDNAKTKFDSSKANVEKLRATLELNTTRLGFTDLISPLNGYILVKSALAGEVLQPGAPVFTAIDLNNVWVTAYIDERDLGRVKLDQEAFVMTDTYPGKKYKGRVSFVSSEAEFTPKFIQTQEERVKLVYRIKVRVDNSSLELKPGMPADAYLSE
ncbi:MAG: efflux RND transporter periplasmic adaptor subunit [Candidatus Omnitrophica bacterium]|nr:efflux RND transporter periplasmic adaptor subunit [Candidatus Omnitrophota bacterium]MBU1869607.1 efflux RND transporter periplasmic adaptor subunit [Candidatus Omnitrophota bacterium]